jgi:hypothetical protein
LDLFAADNHRRQKLSPLVDRINDRYGRCAIGFGLFPPDVRAFKGHAAFHRSRTVVAVRAGQLPAVCAPGRAVNAGPSSAWSISSKVRPLGSGPNTQKPIRPTTLHEAK